MSDAKLNRPPSSVPVLTGYIGLVGLFITFGLFTSYKTGLDAVTEGVLFLLVVAAIMAIYDYFVAQTHKQPESGVDMSRRFSLSAACDKDFAVKMVGLGISLGVAMLYFWVADIYTEFFYFRLFQFVFDNALIIGGVIFVYFAYVHAHMRQPRDSYWHVGCFILSLGHAGDRGQIRHHFLSLGVKIFFLPLMLGFFVNDWGYLRSFEWPENPTSGDYFDYFYRMAYFIDVAFVSIGYVFTLRLFNAHIRWTEQTLGGWIVCLICYVPFWQIFGRYYLAYGDGNVNWHFLEGMPVLYGLWGIVILFLTFTYVISGIHFGLRFSNLTYRGLISHGMYKYTKHPAYVSKNITWWMMDVPFMAADWTLAVRNSLALVGVNLIYIARARYEEKCLSEASEYRDYMGYIREKGLFRALDWERLKAKWDKKTKKLGIIEK